MSAILGAGLTLAGAGFNGIMGAISARKKRLFLDDYEREALNDVNLDINKDYTQTAAAQAGMSNMRKLLLGNTESIAGQQSVIGGTRASVADQKQRMNDAIADASSKIVAEGENLANQAKQQRRDIKRYIAGQRIKAEQQNMEQLAKAGSQFITTVGDIGSDAISETLGKRQLVNGTTDSKIGETKKEKE